MLRTNTNAGQLAHECSASVRGRRVAWWMPRLSGMRGPEVCRLTPLLLLMVCAIPGWSQSFLDEIRIRVIEPSGGEVRPLEEAIIEVQGWGRLRQSNGQEEQGRLPVDGAFMTFEKKQTGWLSKAFLCPNFRPNDYLRERRGGWRDILGSAQNFTLKSCYVYTAPPEPGDYLVQASIDGVAGEIRIPVRSSAPSRREPESYEFPPEAPSQDPYFPLVEHYAPFIAQEAWFNPMADAITRFDFDGDFRGDNNWDNLGRGSTQAYVYYAVMETETHWFLHYNFFHPRDYSDICAVGTCHENDNEGLILAVRKDGTEFGQAEVMTTLAHDVLFHYSNDERIENGAHEVKGPLVMHDGSHPMVFIEAGGHGALGIADGTYSLYDHQVMEWMPESTGITYVYKGVAERPWHAGAEEVGYALLPIYEHWWLRSGPDNRDERTFSDFYRFEPFGGRPSPPSADLGGAFLGVRHAANKAKPFWGWHDMRTLNARILARGQWGLDPAYGLSRNLRLPPEMPLSLDYTFNPYLGIGAPAGAQAAQSTAQQQTVAWDPTRRVAPAATRSPAQATSRTTTPAQPSGTSQPDEAQSGGETSGRPSLAGFGDFAEPGDGWSGSATTDEADSSAKSGQEGVLGWDPSPSADADGTDGGPRGWGPTPDLEPQNQEGGAAGGAGQQTPRGWGRPRNPPNNGNAP